MKRCSVFRLFRAKNVNIRWIDKFILSWHQHLPCFAHINTVPAVPMSAKNNGLIKIPYFTWNLKPRISSRELCTELRLSYFIERIYFNNWKKNPICTRSIKCRLSLHFSFQNKTQMFIWFTLGMKLTVHLNSRVSSLVYLENSSVLLEFKSEKNGHSIRFRWVSRSLRFLTPLAEKKRS